MCFHCYIGYVLHRMVVHMSICSVCTNIDSSGSACIFCGRFPTDNWCLSYVFMFAHLPSFKRFLFIISNGWNQRLQFCMLMPHMHKYAGHCCICVQGGRLTIMPINCFLGNAHVYIVRKDGALWEVTKTATQSCQLGEYSCSNIVTLSCVSTGL